MTNVTIVIAQKNGKLLNIWLDGKFNVEPGWIIKIDGGEKLVVKEVHQL